MKRIEQSIVIFILLNLFYPLQGILLKSPFRRLTTMTPTSTKFTLMQFVNLPGLKALSYIYTNPTYVLPDIHIASVAKLDLDYLKSRGVECLVFDKDNTLR